MKIDPDVCIACGECLDYCPAQAIIEEDNSVYIMENMCFECGVCKRSDVCPVEAFVESEAVGEFPRVTRAFFSDPNTTHKLTMVPGRGTEESKTNDVTGRVKRGEVGACIEFGRPGVGSTLRDISIMTRKLKKMGAKFEANNPLTALMDPETGHFPENLLDESVLSAIVEIELKDLHDLDETISAIMEVSGKIDTVFSLSFISRFEDNGELPILEKLTKLGVAYAPNAKINLGLGRPLVEL
jgi:ferredoxin